MRWIPIVLLSIIASSTAVAAQYKDAEWNTKLEFDQLLKKRNQSLQDIIDLLNNRRCSKIDDYIKLNEWMSKQSYNKTPKQKREEEELALLKRQVEVRRLQNELEQPRAIAKSSPNKMTTSIKDQHDKQLAEVQNLAKVVQKRIGELASGGDQSTRQINYNESIEALSLLIKANQKFWDDWTDPKYSY